MLPRAASHKGARHLSQVHFGPSDDALREIMDRNLEKNSPTALTSSRREALALYRDIWRYSRLFVWRDEAGREWKRVIRDSARQEFEAARHQRDPEAVARLLLTGRDALQQSIDKFMQKRQAIIDRNPAQPPPL